MKQVQRFPHFDGYFTNCFQVKNHFSGLERSSYGVFIRCNRNLQTFRFVHWFDAHCLLRLWSTNYTVDKPNSYTTKDIYNIYSPHQKTTGWSTTLRSEAITRNTFLLCIPKATNRIEEILEKFDAKTVFKLTKKIKDTLR